jgi:hypothetical protein
MATAATAFMGCTGIGMPNATPEYTFARPVKRSVEGNEMEPVRVRATIRGRRVPRSPREPESSGRGCERRVWTLW